MEGWVGGFRGLGCVGTETSFTLHPHEATQATVELTGWPGWPKIRLRLGERDSGCFAKCAGRRKASKGWMVKERVLQATTGLTRSATIGPEDEGARVVGEGRR